MARCTLPENKGDWCIQRKPDSGVPTAGQFYPYYGFFPSQGEAEKRRTQIGGEYTQLGSDLNAGQEWLNTTTSTFLAIGESYRDHDYGMKIHGTND